MGYTPTLSYGNNFEFPGTYTFGVEVTTVATDIGIGTIYIPSTLEGIIKHAYVDVQIGWFMTDQALLNYTTPAFNIQASYGGTQTCVAVPDGAFWIQAGLANVPVGGITLKGAIDVKNRFAKGNSTTLTMLQVSAHHDHIYLTNIQPSVRLVMEG